VLVLEEEKRAAITAVEGDTILCVRLQGFMTDYNRNLNVTPDETYFLTFPPAPRHLED